MKKFVLALTISISLFGCSTVSSINADDYLRSQPTSPSNNLVGIWSGASGPYLNTIKINSDGTGLFCYAWNDKHADGKLIFDGEYIIYQSGEKIKIDNVTSSIIDASSNYYLGSTYKFYKDNSLSKASTYCQNFLSNKT